MSAARVQQGADGLRPPRAAAKRLWAATHVSYNRAEPGCAVAVGKFGKECQTETIKPEVQRTINARVPKSPKSQAQRRNIDTMVPPQAATQHNCLQCIRNNLSHAGTVHLSHKLASTYTTGAGAAWLYNEQTSITTTTTNKKVCMWHTAKCLNLDFDNRWWHRAATFCHKAKCSSGAQPCQHHNTGLLSTAHSKTTPLALNRLLTMPSC